MKNYLTAYAKCRTADEVEVAVQVHVFEHQNRLTKADRGVLNMLLHEAGSIGVAQLHHKSLEAKLCLSNTTVRRSIRKLVKLQIIERIHYIRPDLHGLGANIYVFLPAE